MIRHYLTFAHQAAALDQALKGWTLAECWSQEKNHLVLRFVEGRASRFVEISLDLHVGYALLKKEAHRARKNTIDFFHGALGAQLQHVTIDDGERVIRFRLHGDRQIVLFFFGRGSGNVLFIEQGSVRESLQRDSGEYKGFMEERELSTFPARSELIGRMRDSDLTPDRAVARVIPMLGRHLALEAIDRAGLSECESLTTVAELELLRLLDVVDALYAECEASHEFFIYETSDEPLFALTTLETAARTAGEVERFAEIGSAVRAYRSIFYRTRTIDGLRARLMKRIAAERSRLERARSKGRASSEHAGRAEEWESAGSILLAHLHELERGIPEVTLADFEGAEHTITLDPKLTPAQNADRYFSRARKAREAALQADRQREKIEREVERVEELALAIERAENVEELERVESQNNGIFRMEGAPKEKGTAERFRRFEVVGGHEVFAGKSAANNDELTVRFAKPNDYWFHARGTSGSHVVLRWNDAKQKPPREVLRQAASVAAYYSGSKNAKLVPVAYTLKKHVRKPKGAAVGAVVMEREEVVMVEPKLPSAAEG